MKLLPPGVYTFGQLIDEGILLVSDGYRAKNEELGGDGPIFLRAGHVTDSHIDFAGVDRFHAELAQKVAHKMSAPGDVVVTTKGNSTGRVTYVTDSMPSFVYSPHLSFWRSLKPEWVLPGFLRYWSRGREFREQLSGMAGATDMAPYLSLADQRRLRISIPRASEQILLVEILGTLDQKMDIDRRMNQTLEAMARAIFKSWFVDFELARQGHDWPVVSIYQAADVVYGAPFSSEQFNEAGEGKPLIRIRDLSAQAPTIYTAEEHPKATLVTSGDILVGMDGEFKACLWRGPCGWLNQRVCKFVPIAGYPSAFVWFVIEKPLEFFERSKTGTTVTHLGKSDIDTFGMVLPPREVLERFGELTDPMLKKIIVNAQESRTLAAIRDALLPKLLSGEICVKQAEKIVGEAV